MPILYSYQRNSWSTYSPSPCSHSIANKTTHPSRYNMEPLDSPNNIVYGGEFGAKYPMRLGWEPEKHGEGKLRACDLGKTIAEFYLAELQYFQEKKTQGWFTRFHQYYYKKFHRMGMILVEFCIIALLGELRHLWKKGSDDSCGNPCEYCNEEDCEDVCDEYLEWSNPRDYFYDDADRERELLNDTLDMFSPRTADEAFIDRDRVYRRGLPEELWADFLAVSVEVFFSEVWDRSHGFGGISWGECAMQAQKLYASLATFNTSDIIFYMDRVVNVVHNGGLFLNKFDCTGRRLDDLLEYHKQGSIAGLKFFTKQFCYANHQLCFRVYFKGEI